MHLVKVCRGDCEILDSSVSLVRKLALSEELDSSVTFLCKPSAPFAVHAIAEVRVAKRTVFAKRTAGN